jgi:hypothetical protein
MVLACWLHTSSGFSPTHIHTYTHTHIHIAFLGNVSFTRKSLSQKKSRCWVAPIQFTSEGRLFYRQGPSLWSHDEDSLPDHSIDSLKDAGGQELNSSIHLLLQMGKLKPNES